MKLSDEQAKWILDQLSSMDDDEIVPLSDEEVAKIEADYQRDLQAGMLPPIVSNFDITELLNEFNESD